jgi:hypothetical protein
LLHLQQWIYGGKLRMLFAVAKSDERVGFMRISSLIFTPI